MRRVPIDSAATIAVFAIARLLVSIAALAASAILGFPYDGRAALVLGVFVLWSASVLLLARRDPERALHPAVPQSTSACSSHLSCWRRTRSSGCSWPLCS